MKRLHLITKPVDAHSAATLLELEQKAAEDKWLLDAERAERRRARRFKRRLATQ